MQRVKDKDSQIIFEFLYYFFVKMKINTTYLWVWSMQTLLLLTLFSWVLLYTFNSNAIDTVNKLFLYNCKIPRENSKFANLDFFHGEEHIFETSTCMSSTQGLMTLWPLAISQATHDENFSFTISSFIFSYSRICVRCRYQRQEGCPAYNSQNLMVVHLSFPRIIFKIWI